MTDGRLRALERRWREGGDPGAAAEWLRERVRAGTLDPLRLEVAAYAGLPAARAALGAAAPVPPDGLEAWATGLGRFGAGVEVRAAVVVARALLPFVEREDPADVRVARAVSTAEDWLVCPCPEHVQAAEGAREACLDAAGEYANTVRFWQTGWPAGCAAEAAAAALAGVLANVAPGACARAAVAAATRPFLVPAPRPREAIEAALLGWAAPELAPARGPTDLAGP